MAKLAANPPRPPTKASSFASGEALKTFSAIRIAKVAVTVSNTPAGKDRKSSLRKVARVISSDG